MRAVIVWAGPTGLYTAIALARKMRSPRSSTSIGNLIGGITDRSLIAGSPAAHHWGVKARTPWRAPEPDWFGARRKDGMDR